MATCCEGCSREFRVKNLLLKYDNPRTFVQFQFGCQKGYLVWRICWALYHVAWFIGAWVDWVCFAHIAKPVRELILLTNWAYVLLTLSTIVDAIVVLYVFVRRNDIRRGQCRQMPWYLQMHWCLFVLSAVTSVTITVGYWTLVYKAGSTISVINVALLIINTVYVILNIFVSGTPTRLLHVWFPMVFAAVYVVFTLCYHLLGETSHKNKPYIYTVLDWTRPAMAALYGVMLVFVLAPVVHVVLFGIHCIKLCIFSKCSEPTYFVIRGPAMGE